MSSSFLYFTNSLVFYDDDKYVVWKLRNLNIQSSDIQVYKKIKCSGDVKWAMGTMK